MSNFTLPETFTASILNWVYSEEQGKTVIYAFGRTENGISTCFIVDNYFNRIYFRVPKIKGVNWSTPDARKLINDAITRPIGASGRNLLAGQYVNERESDPVKARAKPLIVERHGIRNPLRDKDSYVRVMYGTTSDVRAAVDACSLKSTCIKYKGQNYHLEPMEDWIDPIKKFTVDTHVTYTGWVTATGERVVKPEYKRTNADIEVRCAWTSIKQSDVTLIAQYTSIHYDLETQGIAGMFPNKFDPRCPITSASYYYTNPSTQEEVRIVVVYGDAKPKSDPNAPISVINVDNEADLLRHHFDIIAKYNPDVVSGYNILGFDEEYIYRRCVKYGVEIPESAGRIKGLESKYYDKSWQIGEAGRWVSVRYIDYVGRVVIDVYKTIVNLPKKLPQNKLDVAAREYLGKGKHDVSPQEMFDAFDEHIRTRNFFKACLASYGPNHEPIPHENVNPEVWKIVCEKYVAGLKRTQKVLDYCMEDTMLSMGLYLKLQVITTLSEAANTFEVPIFDVYTKGQSGKGTSMLYTILCEEKVIFDTYEYTNFEGKYEGALNLGTKYGNRGYFKDVASVDVAGMYPSEIRDKNISHDTEVTQQEAETVYKDKCIHRVWYDYKGTEHERRYETWIIKSDVRRGFLPRLLDRLYNRRLEAKALAKKFYNTNLYFLYDAKQNSIKLAMNSVYGLIGMSTNTRVPAKHLASLVTHMAREELMKIVYFLETGGPPSEWIDERKGTDKEYKHPRFASARIIYGDTDSVQFNYNTIQFESPALMAKYYSDVTKALNVYLSPIILELEKMGNLLLNGPKNYAMRFRDQVYYGSGGAINPNAGNWKDGIDSKGMDTVKQNKAKWHKEGLKQMLTIIMDGDSRYSKQYGEDTFLIEKAKLRDIVDTVYTTLYRAFMNIYPSEMYQIYENYTREGVDSKVGELARRQAAKGRPIEVGDRVPLVFVKFIGETNATLIKEKTRLLTDLDNGDTLDTLYYITQTQTPFDNIMITRYTDSVEFSEFWKPIAVRLMAIFNIDIVLKPNETSKEGFMRHFAAKCKTSKYASELSVFTSLTFDELLKLRETQEYVSKYKQPLRTSVTRIINALLNAGWEIILDTPNLVNKFLITVKYSQQDIIYKFFETVLSPQAYANLANYK